MDNRGLSLVRGKCGGCFVMRDTIVSELREGNGRALRRVVAVSTTDRSQLRAFAMVLSFYQWKTAGRRHVMSCPFEGTRQALRGCAGLVPSRLSMSRVNAPANRAYVLREGWQ